MFELGKKKEIFGADLLKRLSIRGRPSQMPTIAANHKVICGYDQGLGEDLFVCETLEDLQTLYDSYVQGSALKIRWYSGSDEDLSVIEVL